MRYLLLLSFAGLAFGQLPWPFPPQDSVHPLGNSWGSYQDYGGTPYCHNGADIMSPPLWPVTVIRDGYVKAIFLGGSPMYNGIIVADSAGEAFCDGFMYYHVDNSTISVNVGDTVRVGDTMALIARWSIADFHHNHFSKNHNTGIIWASYGTFFKNPLIEMVPDTDSVAPRFFDAVDTQKFAICRNNTSTYLTPDSVYGDVDLICRLEDRVNHRVWKVSVYRIEYSIRDTAGSYVVPLTLSVQMSDSIESYVPGQCRTVYKQDGVCPTNCNYDSLARRYYYIFTNTNGDTMIEDTDSLECWRTESIPNGPYLVSVYAYDEYGNRAAESMLVQVRNPVSSVAEGERSGLPDSVPAGLSVSPNPTPGAAVIRYVPSGASRSVVVVYDALGRAVRSFCPPRDRPRGPYSFTWDGRTREGAAAPSGVYMVRAIGDGARIPPAKLLLLR